LRRGKVPRRPEAERGKVVNVGNLLLGGGRTLACEMVGPMSRFGTCRVPGFPGCGRTPFDGAAWPPTEGLPFPEPDVAGQQRGRARLVRKAVKGVFKGPIQTIRVFQGVLELDESSPFWAATGGILIFRRPQVLPLGADGPVGDRFGNMAGGGGDKPGDGSGLEAPSSGGTRGVGWQGVFSIGAGPTAGHGGNPPLPPGAPQVFP